MTDLFRSKFENNLINPDLIGIVLCGGESKRMKTDKALLEYDNEAQWKIVLKMLQNLCKEVVISINEKQWENWAKNEIGNFIVDKEKYNNHGPLSGILSVTDKFPNEGFMILGTDFPFVKIENLINLNQKRDSSFEAVCFEKAGYLQPLISIIEKQSIPKLQYFFDNGNDSLRHFLGEIRTKIISVNGENFLENINTEEAFLALKNKMVKEFKINKVVGFGNENFSKNDTLAIEEPLEISLKIPSNSGISPLSVTMRTPGNDRDLAIGFLFTEGIVNHKSNLSNKISAQVEENKIIVEFSSEFNPDLEKLKRNFYTTSSCGVCGKESIEAIKQVCKIPITKPDVLLKMKTLFSLSEKLLTVQKTFETTGGIHASALFDLDGNLLNFREDVGRHNALDKLIGAELLKFPAENFSLQDRIVLLSGRASFELIQKCAMAGVPIICSIGAPSSLAVETAENFGITLVGFLKNGNANVYCGADKLDLNSENEN